MTCEINKKKQFIEFLRIEHSSELKRERERWKNWKNFLRTIWNDVIGACRNDDSVKWIVVKTDAQQKQITQTHTHTRGFDSGAKGKTKMWFISLYIDLAEHSMDMRFSHKFSSAYYVLRMLGNSCELGVESIAAAAAATAASDRSPMPYSQPWLCVCVCVCMTTLF